MAKPVKGANATKTTVKTAAQLRKEEEEKRLLEEAAKKAASKNIPVQSADDIRKEQQDVRKVTAADTQKGGSVSSSANKAQNALVANINGTGINAAYTPKGKTAADKAQADVVNRINTGSSLTGREKFKAEQVENYAPKGTKAKTIEVAPATNTQKANERIQRKEKQIDAATPAPVVMLPRTGAEDLQDGDTVYEMEGVRFTLNDLRNQGYTEDQIMKFKSYMGWKYTPQKDKLKQVRIEEKSNTYSPEVAVKNLETKVLGGDYSSDQERNKVQQQYYSALLSAGSDQYVNDALKKAESEIAKLRQAGKDIQFGESYNGTQEEMAQLDEIQNRIAQLNYQVGQLEQIRNSRNTSAVINKIEQNGDAELMRDLANAYQDNISSKRERWANASDYIGGDAYVPYDGDPEYVRLEKEAKKKGYTDEDIATYAQYLLTKDYDNMFGPYLEWIQSHPIAGPIAAGASQVVSSAGRGITRLMTGAAAAETPNAPNVGKVLTDVVKQGNEAAVNGIVDFYSDKNGNPTWYGKSIAKVYQWSTSAVESAALMALAGGATSAIMGMNAAADSYDEALARGLSVKQAAALGITSGVFEALFEWLSLDKIKWFNNTKLTGKKAWAAMLAKSAFVEGSEEVNTDLANLCADFLISGGLSEYNAAMAEGKTPGQFALEKGRELLDSFLGGAFSGGLMGVTSQVTQHGISARNRIAGNIGAGAKVDQYGDVNALIEQGKASGDEKIVKLSKKLEKRIADGKNSAYTKGKLYNLLQTGDVTVAVKQAAIDKGASEKQADAIARGIAAQMTGQIMEPSSETALDTEIGRQIVSEFRGEQSAKWAADLGEKFRERSVIGGTATDRAARAVRNNNRITENRAEINEAVRGGNSYSLIEDGFEGRMGGENGAQVKLGGVVELNGDGKLVVAVDYDAKNGTHAEMVYDPAGAAGTVRSTDVTAEEMYGYAVEFMSGMAGQDAQIGTLYPNDGGMKMSAAAANDMIYVFEPAVNPDTAGYCYFFNDAYKAGRSGVSWGGYLDVVGRDSKAEWADILTETQLREAFRAGQMEFSPAKGVTRIGTARLSDKALNRLSVLDGIMKKLGFSVIAVDTIEDKNGYVSDRADVAVINLLGADRGLFEVAAFHEVLHVVTRELGVRSGRQFVDAVLGVYRETVSSEQYDSDYAKVKRRYGEDLAGLDEEAADRLIKEELAAQYFAGVATNHMDRFVARLEQGGSELLAKVREALKTFADELKKALNRLAGLDPATAAALRTEAAQAERIFDLFEEAARQAEEVREQRLAEQGGTLKQQAEKGQIGERSAESGDTTTNSIKVTRNMNYAEQLRQIEDRKLNGSNSLYIGTAPALTAAGFSDAPFAMNQADYRKARRKEGKNKNYSSHAVPLKYFKILPQKLNESVIFINNGIKVTVVTDYKMLDNNGQPSFVVAGVWQNQKMDNDVVNQIKSTYPLDDFTNRILQAGKDGKLIVTDKSKAEELLASIGVQPAEQSSILGLAKSSIAQEDTKSQEDNSGTRNSYKIANDSENGRDQMIVQEAKRHFGTTDDYRTAGYMLRDGELLDFSGAHWLAGNDEQYIADWRSKNDIRQVDHEDIFGAFEAVEEDFPSDSSLAFMQMGNIRMVPESPGVELSAQTEPTAEQYRRLKDYISTVGEDGAHYYNDRFSVDLTTDRKHKAGTLHYTGNINADRIINDIKHFYATGEVREQNTVERFMYSRKVDFSYKELTQLPDLQGNIVSQNVKTNNGVVDVKWLVGEIQKQCNSVYVGKSTTPTYYLPCDDLEGNIEISSSGLVHGLIKSQTGKISPSEQVHARILLDIKNVLKNAIEVNRSNRPNGFDSVGQSILLGVTSLKDGNKTDMYAVKFVVDHRKNQAPVLVEMNVLSKLYSANTKKIDPAMLRQKGIALTNSGRFSISVADLIDLVKEDYDDIFSNDVYTHFGMQRAVTKDTPYLMFSRKVEDVRGKFDAAAAGGEMLGQMLDETLKLLHKAHTELDKAQYDAWLQGETTEGRVKTRKGVLSVVKKYNDEKLTGVSNEDFTDRIMQAFMDLKDYDYGAEELVNAVLDVMADKAAAQVETVENETRDIIRGITDGAKYVVSDGEFRELTETLGGRRAMNDVFRTVYGFTLVPEREAQRRGASVSFDAGMQEVTEALPGLFANSSASLFGYDTDNGSVINMATALFEMQDAMQVQERTAAQELGLDKLDQNSDEALEATMTLYERAYQDAIDMAEDLIRLTPVRTLADTYVGKLDELRQAAKGQLQARQKEIAALMDRIETAEVGVSMAAQVNRTLTDEAAKMERQIGELENELADARYALRQAEETGRGQATALAEKVNGLEEQIAGLKDDLKKERAKVTRRDVALIDARADRDARLKAQREYYQEMRHKQVEQRQDTANKQKLRKLIVHNVLWLNRRLATPTDKQHIPEELRTTVGPFVEAFAAMQKTDLGWYMFKKDVIDDLLTFYRRLNDADEANHDTAAENSVFYGKYYVKDIDNMLQALKETVGGKRFTELTAPELSMLDNIMAHIRKMAEDGNDVFLDGKRVDFAASAGTFIDETAKKAKHRSPLLQKIKDGTDGININMAKPIYLFKEIVGGEIGKYFDEIREAQNRWAFMVSDAAKVIQEIKDRYHYKDWKDDGIAFTLSDGTTLILTKDAVLQIYATYKREQAQIVPSEHLTKGGIVLSDELEGKQTADELRKALKRDKKYNTNEFDALMQANREKITRMAHHLTAEDLVKLGNTLTDEQRAYADAVVRYMSSTVSEWGNETSMAMYGYKKFREKYYFPFQSSSLFLHQSIGMSEDARMKNKGFTKPTVKRANNPIVITGFSEVAAQHIGEMASYSALTAPLEDINRLLQFKLDDGRSVKEQLAFTYGGQVYQYMNTFITQMNGGTRQDVTVGTLNKLTGNFKRAAVALNFSVMVQQPSAVARAMAMVDPIYFVRSTANFFSYKELMKYSGVAVIKSFGGFDTDVGKSTKDYILGESNYWEKLSEWTGKGAEVMDNVTWSHIWNAVKRETAHEMGIKYHRKGMSEEFYRRSAARFNEVADYTQVYDSTISRSQLMRSNDTGIKMATAFMAEPTTTYNMLLFSGMKKNGKAINKGAALGAFVCNVALNTALQSLVGAWRDKDDESYFERWFKRLVQGVFGTRENAFLDSEFNLLNMIPFIKDFLSIMQGYDVERSDMQLFTDLWKSFDKLRKAFADREDDVALFDFMKANSELLLSFGVNLTNLTPIPLKSLYKDFWLGGKNAAEHLRDGDFHTTAQHIADIWKQNFEGEWNKNEQLYYAVLNGEKELLDRYTKVTRADIEKYITKETDELEAKEYAILQKEKDMHDRISKALMQVDERIRKAAELTYAGDVERADKLAEAVAADGFSLSDVYHAVNLTFKELYPEETEYKGELKEYELVTNDMLDKAFYDDMPHTVIQMRDRLIEQGKAASTVDTHIGDLIDDDYAIGEINLADAKRMYKDFTNLSDKKVTDRLAKAAAKLYDNDEDVSYDTLRGVYKDIGVAEEDIAKNLGEAVVADYQDGKFASKDAAVKEYMRLTGETDRETAGIQFDYADAKAKDDNYPLTYSNYKKYVESGLINTGVSADQYDKFLNATNNIDGNTTSAGWENYAARTAGLKNNQKYTAKQWHYVQAIDETFDTVEQKDAAYRAVAASENWKLTKLPLAPWH